MSAIVVTARTLVHVDTVWVFEGTTQDGRVVQFGVDHRMGQDLIDLISEHGEVVCSVEPWQIVEGLS